MNGKGFPKRRPDAAQYGEAPTQPSSAAKSSSSVGGKNDDPGAFLEYIHCHLCSHPFYAEPGQETRQFFMTSCGHIVCNDQAHNHKKERCTVCGKGGEEAPVTVTLLDDQMPMELQNWFMAPAANNALMGDSCSRNKFHIKELMRHIAYLNSKLEHKSKLFVTLRDEFKQYKQLQEDYKKLEEINAALQKENAEFKRRDAFQDTAQLRYPPFMAAQGVSIPRAGSAAPIYNSNMTTHRPPFDHIPMDTHNNYEALPPVIEEEEEDAKAYKHNEHLGKRMRTDGDGVASQTSLDPLTAYRQKEISRPSSAIPGSISRPPAVLSTRYGDMSSANNGQVLSTPRPHSSVGGPRTNLSQFRFEPARQEDGSTPNQRSTPFQLHRSDSAMGRPVSGGGPGPSTLAFRNRMRTSATGPNRYM